MGLRFLAAHVLGLRVQEDTHDSIEDARTALALLNEHRALQQRGTLKQTIDRLYDVGQQTGWKV